MTEKKCAPNAMEMGVMAALAEDSYFEQETWNIRPLLLLKNLLSFILRERGIISQFQKHIEIY